MGLKKDGNTVHMMWATYPLEMEIGDGIEGIYQGHFG